MSTPPVPRSPGPTSPGSTRQMLDELDALMQRMLELPVNQLGDEPAVAAEARRDSPPAAERVPPPAPATERAPAAPVEARPEPVAPRPAPKLIAHPPAPFPPLPHREPAPRRPAGETDTESDEPAMIIPPAGQPSAAPAPTLPPGPAPLPAPRPAPAPRLSPLRPLPLPARPAAPPSRVPAWVLRSLLWSNRTFDRCTGWLGTPGRWLRSPRGRLVLGWAGLGLWALALTLAVLRFLR